MVPVEGGKWVRAEAADPGIGARTVNPLMDSESSFMLHNN